MSKNAFHLFPQSHFAFSACIIPAKTLQEVIRLWNRLLFFILLIILDLIGKEETARYTNRKVGSVDLDAY